MKPEELSSIKLDISKRHDEICDAAFEYHCRWQNRPPEWRPDIATAFNDGAKWADEHPRWISVEDELPPLNETFIAGFSDGEAMLVNFDNRDEERQDYIKTVKTFTHWQYLPQPPKKGGEE